MKLRHLVLFILLWFGGIFAYKFWPEEKVVHAAGVLISDAPYQRAIDNGKSWNKNGCVIVPLAEFNKRNIHAGVKQGSRRSIWRWGGEGCRINAFSSTLASPSTAAGISGAPTKC